MNGKIIRNQRIWFWAVFGGAVFLRALSFGQIPNGINQDEAMGAVDAWALSLYGTDRFGVRLPVHFSAWQVSQMSVLLSYLMIPFIKILGFGIWAIRLPMLLASAGGIVLIYLIGKKMGGFRLGIVAMALAAINPWHFMQSRWSIDCNLFPHVFLLAFYLLLLGIQKKRYLYAAMVFFGLTFYCYGIAVYSVPLFLAVFALWGWKKKLFSIKDVLFCALIFGLTALPEVLVMAINLLHLGSIETGFITMSYFPESVRKSDILFLDFSMFRLKQNIWHLAKTCFLQMPGEWYNAIPFFGPMYHFSIPFMAGGVFLLTRDLFRERDVDRQAQKLALAGFLLTGAWVGAVTREVNVNRVNIIFYPLILITAYCICQLADKNIKWLTAAGMAYALCGVLFLGTYFTVYPKQVAQCYNGEFLEAVRAVDEAQDAEIYISSNLGWTGDLPMAEILTIYACRIDALYFQGKSQTSGGRQLAPYVERYHYMDAEAFDWKGGSPDALYLVHEGDLAWAGADYAVLQRIGQFVILRRAGG